MSIRSSFDAWRAGLPARLAGYKTHLFALMVFVVGVLETIDPYMLASVLPDRWGGVGMIGLSLAIAFLRQRTQDRSPIPGFRPHLRGTEDD